MTRTRSLGLIYLSPYILGLMAFTAIPFLASFYLSFTDYNLMQPPKWTGLENYIELFTSDRTFRRSLSVTLLYVFLTVPLKLAFALFIAYILNYKLRCINLFRTAFYVPSILGGSIAIAVLWRYIFATEGLVNMVLAWFGIEPVNWFGDPTNALFTITLLRCWQFGSAMVIFLAALQSIDKSLYEAAAIDGGDHAHQRGVLDRAQHPSRSDVDQAPRAVAQGAPLVELQPRHRAVPHALDRREAGAADDEIGGHATHRVSRGSTPR
jgi:oligogalacturonide transport system permease protein